MVSTRRSGSLPSNNTKRSSSPSDDNHNKPASPKRQKGESCNINSSSGHPKTLEPSPAQNPKEISSADPPELSFTTTAAPAAAASLSVATPVAAEGAVAAVVDKQRSSFTSSKQHQGFETTTPWCRLLNESPQNPTVPVYRTNFSVGSSKHANLLIRDQSISAILCSIRLSQHDQRDDKPIAVLESLGSKGCIQVNGKTIKKDTNCDLNSGDEVVFGFLGSHSYVFQQLPYDKIIKATPPDVQTSLGKLIQVERRAGDVSAVAGASILASLSNLRQDLSNLKSTCQGNGSEAATDVGAATQILPLDGNVESGLEEERDCIRDPIPASLSGTCPRSSAFRKDILAAILDERHSEVSFDNFPYYLSESTKSVLVAASYIQLKLKDQLKFTSELPTLNPRILLSGPAGSDIYQEMLAKALAHYFGAKLLIFDSHSFLGGSKDTELPREGNNAERACSTKNKVPGSTDLPKDSGLSSGEADGPNTSSTSLGLNSQTKTETDDMPSSASATENLLIKFGDRVKFVGPASGGLYSNSAS